MTLVAGMALNWKGHIEMAPAPRGQFFFAIFFPFAASSIALG
jgi:hypothetical protein